MKTVPLHGVKAAGRAALVDDQDYELVSQYRWFAREDATGNHVRTYAYTSWGTKGRQTFIQMHNLITGYLGVDHRDHDGLNNTRANLRPATQSQNNANSRKRAGTSSRFRGVTWYRSKKRWQAQIKVGRQNHSLGYFDAEDAAARAYDAAALAAFGEFATLNFPEGD